MHAHIVPNSGFNSDVWGHFGFPGSEDGMVKALYYLTLFCHDSISASVVYIIVRLLCAALLCMHIC